MSADQSGPFVAAALPILVGLQHQLRIQAIMQNAYDVVDETPLLHRQLLPGLGFTKDDLVKVTEHYTHGGIDIHGRVGQVVGVHDYRSLNYDLPHLMQAIIVVKILSGRHNGVAQWLPGAAALEPHELELLHQGAGDWVKARRVVSPQYWPAARDGMSA